MRRQERGRGKEIGRTIELERTGMEIIEFGEGPKESWDRYRKERGR